MLLLKYLREKRKKKAFLANYSMAIETYKGGNLKQAIAELELAKQYLSDTDEEKADQAKLIDKWIQLCQSQIEDKQVARLEDIANPATTKNSDQFRELVLKASEAEKDGSHWIAIQLLELAKECSKPNQQTQRFLDYVDGQLEKLRSINS